MAQLLFDILVRTHPALSVDGGAAGSVTMVPFDGTVDGPLMSGRIASGGVDTQRVNAAGVRHLSARYILEGEAKAAYGGGPCRVYVENEAWFPDGSNLPFATVPRFLTDHPALRPILARPAVGEAVGEADGLHIRLYAAEEQ